ncbi:MAG: 50S ribosomal protein L29 [Oscillospiraceae bacterium]|jgi:large subunit ribosomal protein L29|nr:50S ribosomal protein L29 [Oscillospiraceae bacterium]
MNASEVRALSSEELGVKLTELKKDLFMLRMQLATNQLSNPMKIHEVKHAIARVKTVQRERELAR